MPTFRSEALRTKGDEAVRRRHDEVLLKWSYMRQGKSSEEPRTIVIHRLALATAFDDLLAYVEILTTIPLDLHPLQEPGLINRMLSWAERLSDMYTQISFSRRFPVNKAQRFLDVSLTLLLLVTTVSHPSLEYRFRD